jgi:crotonobetainyl-CoA:carnitine CoA-transferase CaiB-like acyl-CoA transferase
MHGGPSDDVGPDLLGPAPWRHLYRASDGWMAVCAVTSVQQDALGTALEVEELSVPVVALAVGAMTLAEVGARLEAHGVPSAVSIHPGAVLDDEQVRDRGLLAIFRHSVAGPFVQVGIPLQLSVDMPAVKSPAPAPVRPRHRSGARP